MPNEELAAPRAQRDELSEVAELYRLYEMVVEARLGALPAVLGLSPTGECDEHDAVEVALLADARGELEAVQPGHGEIEQRDLGTERAHLLQSRCPVVRDQHLDAVQAQQQRETVGGVAIVVDDEKAPPRGGARK